MRAILATIIFCVGLMLSAATALAHHSFVAEFDIKQVVNLTGVLTKMEWTNPHSWLYIDVKDESGKVVSWAIETGAPSSLLRKGLRKTDFPIGSEVVVKGYRSRDGSPTANGETVTFKDGRNFFLGNSSENPVAPAK